MGKQIVSKTISETVAESIDLIIRGQRMERFNRSNQLSLGGLIELLERVKDKSLEIAYDFEYAYPTTAHSWRGAYEELAIDFEFDGERSDAQAFLDYLKERVLDQTFTGWKGGDYTMTKDVPVWVANPGNSGNRGVYGIKETDWRVLIFTGCCEY